MATLRELKARIGSVASTEKITGAMKMISSAKMHKAELSIKQLRPYRSQIETIIANLLSADTAVESPLMTVREIGSVAIVVWGSDNGLCGGYNMNLYKQVVSRVAEVREQYGPSVRITVIPVGSKIAKPVQKLVPEGIAVATDYNVDSKSDEAAVKAFTERLQQEFLSGVYDKIEAVSTQFLSVSRQRIASVQLLPIEAASLSSAAENGASKVKPYIFEPSVESIFRTALPLFQQAVMQDIFTQNVASEQAARVMAMQSANDNARKLLEQLRLEYNKLRQQSITNELLDIVGGQVR
ncbi:MAG: ATP synthase F1 subunit gamma [Muribaculaceae bacterium]|nr:ATP synthase F1 subunit gamma [Muribaculaceae bacterium]